MTENKRFTVDGLTITENSQKGRKYLLEYQGGVNALCNRINGLFDKSKRLEKENKELKSKVDDKQVAVEVETCKIMEKVFALINDKIIFVNACEENSQIQNDDYYRGALEILELLKKELKYDRE